MSTNVPANLIVSEILCFIQSKMNTSEHDFMVKSVVSFYSEDAIHEAKILLFEECIETKLRLKTYRKEKAKQDCEDIIVKFNEVGSGCPRFVAADLSNVPITTSDAFDLAKLSKSIEHVLQLESQVSDSFAALSCLQVDFKSVLQRCNKIDVLTDEIMALKLSIAAKDGGLPLPQPASMPIVENLVDIDSQSDISSVKSESSDDELLVLDADDKQEEPEQEPNQPKVKWSAVSRDYHSNMTDGGFKLVGKIGKPSRTFTNSSLKPQHHARHRGESNKYCSVFVSNLTTDTKVSDVVSFLREKHNRHFKVVQIPSKFNDCVSFKVVVPFEMKDTMLDKRNWKKNVYIREFFENSRSLASLSAKY